MNVAIFLIFLLIPSIYSSIFTRTKDSSVFLSKSNTDALRGIAIIMVIVAHYSLEMGVTFLGFLGGIGVTLFLFLSGYGLNESFKRNGLSHFFSKRISRILIPYWIVLLIIAIIVWKDTNWVAFLKDIFGIKTSYWYIGFILRWYIVFYFSKIFPLAFRPYCLFVYSVIVLILYPEHQNLQFLSFPLGVETSNHLKYLKEFSQKKYFILANSCFITGITLLILYNQYLDNIVSSNIILVGLYKSLYYLSITFSIILFTQLLPKILISSYLIYLGGLSYELYLTHLPLIKITNHIAINHDRWYVWVIAFIISVFVSLILKYTHSYIIKFINYGNMV